ncbi:MAG: ATP-dependent Clp protease proteolytic subunit [Phycisphaerales bacterium]|nr:ATP-dependent Clp protease proteolytic subunit [Phycisphaerales bacterium]
MIARGHHQSRFGASTSLRTPRGVLSAMLATFACVALLLMGGPAWGQGPSAAPSTSGKDQTPPPVSSASPTNQLYRGIPAARAAKNVAVITIHGEIDEWTARSVQRRIEFAEASNADAIVFDIDTPGGELQAMLVISGMIKRGKIANTVAWINPNAYSAGSVIALACREIVIAEGAAFGDALPIEISLFEGFKAIPDAEREKFLGPVMADLIESARRNGKDEVLVQGLVRRGVELWLIEHATTGERLFVTEAQYRVAVGEEPQRLSPTTRSITGPVDPKRRTRNLTGGAARAPGSASPDAPGTAGKATDVVPAAPDMSPKLLAEVNQSLDNVGAPSVRPNLAAAEHAGKYKVIEYVSDGSGVLTLRDAELLRYRVAVEKVRDDQELKNFFGSPNIARLDEGWSERLARLLSHIAVKALLIVVFLIALFVEMTHPGLILPGLIAAFCLVGLVLPPIIAGLAGWWTVVAILAGIALIAAELFIAPGVGIFAVLGVLLLFGGIVGTFVTTGRGLFPGGPAGSGGGAGEVAWALVVTFGSIFVAGVVIALIARNFQNLPMLNRLVLKSASGDPPPEDLLVAMTEPEPAIPAGTTGVAITTLRPSGRVQVGEKIIDAIADSGIIPAGAQVRVVRSNSFETIVEFIS